MGKLIAFFVQNVATAPDLLADTAQHCARRTGTARRSQEAHYDDGVGMRVTCRPRRHGNERRLAAAGLAVQHERPASCLRGGCDVIHVAGDQGQ